MNPLHGIIFLGALFGSVIGASTGGAGGLIGGAFLGGLLAFGAAFLWWLFAVHFPSKASSAPDLTSDIVRAQLTKMVGTELLRKTSLSTWKQAVQEGILPTDWIPAINDFVIPNGVLAMRFMANYIHLSEQGISESEDTPGTQFLQPTKSALKFTRIVDRPNGYPLWFLSAFPDVADYLSTVFENPNDRAHHDLVRTLVSLRKLEKSPVHEVMSLEQLRLLLTFFRAYTKQTLECSS